MQQRIRKGRRDDSPDKHERPLPKRNKRMNWYSPHLWPAINEAMVEAGSVNAFAHSRMVRVALASTGSMRGLCFVQYDEVMIQGGTVSKARGME